MGKIHKKYIVDNSGHKTAVVIPINEYKEMMEDLHDLVIIAERKDEPDIDFEEVKRNPHTSS